MGLFTELRLLKIHDPDNSSYNFKFILFFIALFITDHMYMDLRLTRVFQWVDLRLNYKFDLS